MSDPVLTLEQAEALAARTLAAINAWHDGADDEWRAYFTADRERVASDLDGLRDVYEPHLPMEPGDILPARAARHARRYSDGLRRTAELYEEKP